MDNTLIAVAGAGQMGAGIAQVVSAAGFNVFLYDLEKEFLERGKGRIEASLNKLTSKGGLGDQTKAGVLSRVKFTTKLKDCAEAFFIIEAIVENSEAKKNLFQQLDKFCSQTSVFASNTSSISITKLAAPNSNPQRFIGMHFMNPVPIMKLVEVIRGLQTSDEVHAKTLELSKKLGKIPIEAQDSPAFVINRILCPMINEAIYALQEGLASIEDIDKAMKLGTNQPMGPFELADFVGLDTLLAVLEVMHQEIGDPKYRPCPLLRKYVDAGWLGRKTGKGFYPY